MKLRAVIFDMDGVIADTEPIHIKAWSQFMITRQVHLSLDYFEKFVGMADLKMMKIINEENGLNISSDEAVSEKNFIFKQLIEKNGLRPNSGVGAAWSLLRQYGVKIGLATSSPKQTTVLILQSVFSHLGIQDEPRSFFDAMVTREDIKECKPAPDSYSLATSLLGVESCNVMAVEDSPSGVAAAVTAGLDCVALVSPYYGRDDLSKAHNTIVSIEDLITNRFFGRLPG